MNPPNRLPDGNLNDVVCRLTDAREVAGWEPIQELWSGYGQLWRVALSGGPHQTAIVKSIQPPRQSKQPRGWNTDDSHRRKLRSYEVEVCFYQDWGHRLPRSCRVADCLGLESVGGRHVIILEDLDRSGFPARHASLDLSGVMVGLDWLASFHASTMQVDPIGLWPVGTYWHLGTRREELARMKDHDPLKRHAAAIDQRLSAATYKSLVHGDAKVANFCFSESGQQVAAVDFQYVGGGCGVKDIVYFLGSCLSEDACERWADQCLDHYFRSLRHQMDEQGKATADADALESEWRFLYPVAWADFHRFLTGWYPQHHKLHGYSRAMTRAALGILGGSL